MDAHFVPNLTIGLPVYNGENFLAESIDALLAQTYDDYELVISDNASAAGTAEIHSTTDFTARSEPLVKLGAAEIARIRAALAKADVRPEGAVLPAAA